MLRLKMNKMMWEKMMSCNCRKEMEAKLVEYTQTQVPAATQMKVALQGYSYSLGSQLLERSSMPYKATFTVPKKDGTPRAMTKTGNMFFNYCPFCGVKQS